MLIVKVKKKHDNAMYNYIINTLFNNLHIFERINIYIF